MTKSQFIQNLAKNSQTIISSVTDIYGSFMLTLVEAIQGGKTNLPKLGTFELGARARPRGGCVWHSLQN